MSNTAPSRADPVVVFPLADGAHHKKPHSPTHPDIHSHVSYFGVQATRERSTKITFKWVHKQFIMIVYTSFISYICHDELIHDDQKTIYTQRFYMSSMSDLLCLCAGDDVKIHCTTTWVLSAPGGPHVGPMLLAPWTLLSGLSIMIQACKNWWDITFILNDIHDQSCKKLWSIPQ